MTPNYSGMLSWGWLTHRAIHIRGKTRHLVFSADDLPGSREINRLVPDPHRDFGDKVQPKF